MISQLCLTVYYLSKMKRQHIQQLFKGGVSKRAYLPPICELKKVELEQGIVSGSATINPVGPVDETYPEVNDWMDGGGDSRDIDL